ncbi:MAG: hypothetical protein KGL42_07885, partial [Betaproteobacteria bacterium]|nr:hypothetical protein [Betaproteobacteria bacterium]
PKRRLVAPPMPPPPRVTMTVLPSNRCMMFPIKREAGDRKLRAVVSHAASGEPLFMTIYLLIIRLIILVFKRKYRGHAIVYTYIDGLQRKRSEPTARPLATFVSQSID